MPQFRLPRPMLAAVAACSVALAACGGDDANENVPFDPQGTAQDVEVVEAIVTSPEMASVFAALQGSEDLVATVRAPLAGLRAADPRASAVAAAARLREVASPDGGPALLAAVLPSEALGVTFIYDAAQGRYVASGLPGAPANGARFVLYAVDPLTGEPALPLQQTGYADVLDESTASSDVVRIVAVSGATTIVDYRVAATVGTTSATVTVDGFLSDGAERLEFDLDATVSAGGVVFDYDVTVPSRGFSFSVDLTLADNGGSPTIDVNMRLSGPNGNVAITGDLAQQTSTLVVSANGGTFAILTFTDMGVEVTDANGQPLDAQEQAALLYIWNLFDEAFELVDALLGPLNGVVV